jgi:hypothetical protein
MPVWADWLLNSKASCRNYRCVDTNWTSRLGRRLAGLFAWRTPDSYIDYADRDAERIARELELIRMRFPHHA